MTPIGFAFPFAVRLKIKMANPNYQKDKVVAYPSLAKPDVLTANEWTTVPRTEVPLETFWYVVEDRVLTPEAAAWIRGNCERRASFDSHTGPVDRTVSVYRRHTPAAPAGAGAR